jgi:hypothetical protein
MFKSSFLCKLHYLKWFELEIFDILLVHNELEGFVKKEL